MADYGVQPTGFVRKPLSAILSEIEAVLITEFGPGVVQTSQSPLGQINGLFANLTARLWEDAEDLYQSYDPDQAEGTRLDILGRLRLLERAGGETDQSLRQAITNAGRARIDLQDLSRAIVALDGVTYCQVFVNDTPTMNADGIPPNCVVVAVLGGDQNDIAAHMRQYIVPGISTFGNVSVSTSIDGFCRNMLIVRPILVPVGLTIKVKVGPDRLGCPPPSTTAIKAALSEDLSLINGQDISWFLIRSIIEARFPTVEVVSIIGTRDGQPEAENQGVVINFIELATIDIDDVTVIVQ